MWCLVCLSGSQIDWETNICLLHIWFPLFATACTMHHRRKAGWLPQCIRQSLGLLQLWPAGRPSFATFRTLNVLFCITHPRSREMLWRARFKILEPDLLDESDIMQPSSNWLISLESSTRNARTGKITISLLVRKQWQGPENQGLSVYIHVIYNQN